MIGLKRGTVKLVHYNPNWPQVFEQEKKLLQNVFGRTIIAIEHIGSTAIAGIYSKPVIDINIGVESFETARNMIEKFKEINYEFRPFVPGYTIEELRSQELYVKGPDYNRTHYVHVTIFNGAYWKNNLQFRDFLRNNQSIAKEYSELKEKLAGKYPLNRKAYTDNKDKFIKSVLSICNQQ